MLKILINPNPILRKKSKPLSHEQIKDNLLQKYAKEMVETMIKSDGVGLSSPQVGKNIRLIVINTKEGPLILFNPKIIIKSWAREFGQEGCLSVPGIFGKVKRHKKITCSYIDKKGKKIKLSAEGLLARIVQHEIDHLNGILFIDKAVELVKDS